MSRLAAQSALVHPAVEFDEYVEVPVQASVRKVRGS